MTQQPPGLTDALAALGRYAYQPTSPGHPTREAAATILRHVSALEMENAALRAATGLSPVPTVPASPPAPVQAPPAPAPFPAYPRNPEIPF